MKNKQPPPTAILPTGTRVTTWDGHSGVILYARDGWYGVRVDGEPGNWEYQGVQLEEPEAK